MEYIDTDVVGKIIPLQVGTRFRNEPHTKAGYLLPNYGPSDVIEVDTVREYTANDDFYSVTKGDKWGRVFRVNGQPRTGWMAIIYQKVSPPNICTPAYTVVDAPPPPAGEKPKIIGATVVAKYDDGSVSEPVELKVG